METVYVVTNWDDKTDVTVFRNKKDAIEYMYTECVDSDMVVPVHVDGLSISIDASLSAISLDSLLYLSLYELSNFFSYYEIVEADLR